MATVPASLRRSVIQRANDRCEYCGISQIGQVATFHVDHIVPVVAGGETIAENLALACVSCSLRKGARQELEDSETGETVSIFNPRQ
ncbi:MAG: HNH endonuclease [Leptolyngbyaceae cyanobacterium SM1_3_5]|nr:HNH endonuclease [Leptolyngbyaceae cyanobacterium SM1_3_5]